jgi:hypothetical protein
MDENIASRKPCDRMDYCLSPIERISETDGYYNEKNLFCCSELKKGNPWGNP